MATFGDLLRAPGGTQSIYDPSYKGYGYSDPTRGHVYGQAWKPQPTAPAPAPTGDILGTQAPTPTGPSPQELEVQRREEERRARIESGYGDYFSQLDVMLREGLPYQRGIQEQLVSGAYERGKEQLETQKRLEEQQIAFQEEKVKKEQARSLKDISTNIRQMFESGQRYLGGLGADGSASRMYSYALTKLGSQKRGDIMARSGDYLSQLGQNALRLNEIYSSEMRNLLQEKETRALGVAQWFANAQQALREQRRAGTLAKTKDLQRLSETMLNSALNSLASVNDQIANRQSTLEAWALSRAENISEAQRNLQAIGDFRPPVVSYSPYPVSQGGIQFGQFQPPTYHPGYGYLTEEDRRY